MSERQHHLDRARAEREAADNAADETAKRAHQKLADYHERKAHALNVESWVGSK